MLDWIRKDTFRHGVHPPEMKDDTADLAIRQFPFAPVPEGVFPDPVQHRAVVLTSSSGPS